MSHEIETMAFVGETPWHGLGRSIDYVDAGDIEGFQIEAGLDWEVRLDNNRKADGTPIEGSFYIERLSDGSVLGKSVTNLYKPVQNAALFDFFRPYVDSGKLHLHTAGSLFGGRKVWVMGSPMRGFTLDGNDDVSSNAIFTLDHTGLRANSMMLSPVRVVCNNTWTLAKQIASDEVKHNHKVAFDPELMDAALNYFNAAFDDFEKEAIAMARRVLTGEEEIEFFQRVFGGKEKEVDGKVIRSRAVQKALAMSRGKELPKTNTKTGPTKAETQSKLDALTRLMEEAAQSGKVLDTDQLASITGKSDDDDNTDSGRVINPGHDLESTRRDDGVTVWGAFQTVTNIIDHNPVKAYKSDDHRADRALYGAPAGQRDAKSIALQAARELVAA
jgi:phage/plasmid-like protein (TIGR03299 family)